MSNDDATIRKLDCHLDEWRALTVAELESIEGGDWKTLEEIQSKKALLRQDIEELESAFSSSPTMPQDRKEAERKRLRQIATELLALEKKNEAVLSERIVEADRELKHSNKTIQSLRHVQKAYGSGRPSFWQAYS